MSSTQKPSDGKSKLFIATASGLLTILLWSSLAVMTTSLPNIPRFQLLWFGFGEAFIIGSIILAFTGRLSEMAQPFAPWFTAFCGIFFFHLLYFIGLNFAPPAKVTLLSYLWPTMLVVCIAFLSKKHFHIAYLLGALMGLIGTVFLMPADKGSVLTAGVFLGYFLGCLCAIVWTIYSIVNRKYTSVPTGMIIGVCGGISLVSMAIHFAFEPTVMPQSFKEILIILYLGCGPMGIAFLAWDYATKNANLSLMGSLSYLAPLLSTLWLVLAGRAPGTIGLLIAVLLIVGGAVVATYPLKKAKGS